MSIIQEIFNWSRDQDAWQQDAISRLYDGRDLSSEDLEDLYALLKVEKGIPDTQGRRPRRLKDADLAVPPTPTKLIQFTAIKNLENVNALAPRKMLPLNPSGLSVIYGENGAGKSGYSRLLKKACRARDQREQILPNANNAGGLGPARATFELLTNGEASEVHWENGKVSPEDLSAIAIFDSHCARAYIDNQGDFAYAPYGLDILEGLVKLCGHLKAKVMKEMADNKPNLDPLKTLMQTQTAVGRLLSSISASTKIPDVDALSVLMPAEVARHDSLTKALAQTDPKQKAQALRLKATRFEILAARIQKFQNLLGDAKISEVRELIEKAKVAKDAAALASKNFIDNPALLPGTGGDIWRSLFEAAREYSAQAYPGKVFPQLASDDKCPLCQNPLREDGVSRLGSFERFLQEAAEQAAKTAREAAAAAYRVIDKSEIDFGIDPALSVELADWTPDLKALCPEALESLKKRQQEVRDAAGGGIQWDSISALSVQLLEALDAAKTSMNTEAKALEASMDEKAKAAMVLEHGELEARRRLSEIRSVVVDVIAKLSLIEKLKACLDALEPGAISRKSTALARAMATPALASALNAELESLNVHELRIVMKNVSPGGKTQFKLALEMPGGGNPGNILSEGEQRAIAIASFLAEVNLGDNPGGVVFDDPVSSLDHRRRWHVARRLAQEAQKRQVIVLTHDIYFLCILQKEAEALGLDPLLQSIRKTSDGFGVHADRLPFDAMSTSKRVKALRNQQVEAARLHKNGDEEAVKKAIRDAYNSLRMAWERATEEILFQGVISRFDEGVSTQKLRYVVVEEDDYRTIDAGMTKCSKFAHDTAMPAQLSIPHPDELKVDIEILEAWRKKVEDRKNAVGEQRS